MLSNSRSAAALRALVIVLLIAVWLGVGAIGGMAQGKLSEVQSNDAASFLPASAESTRAAELNRAFVDSETLPALVVLTAPEGGAISPEQLAAVEDFAAGIPALPITGADPAAGDPATIGDVLTADPVVVPSEDGAALLVPLSLDGPAAEESLADDSSVVGGVVGSLRDALSSDLGATSESVGAVGLNAWVTGPAGFVADLVTAFGGIDVTLLLVALGAVLVILVVVYRSPFLPFLVIFTAVFALSAASLVVYHLAKNDLITLNGQTQGILSILVVGASVDYALLLVARYREELRHVESPFVAMARAMRVSVAPIAASAGTVIAGLLCLTLSDLGSNKALGPVGSLGIVAAFVAVMTLLPAFLLVLGKRSRALFWPRVPRQVDAGTHATVPGTLSTAEILSGGWGRLAGFVGRHPRRVWVVTALALLAGAAFLPTLQASGTSQTDIFLTKVDAVSGQKELAEHFPAGAVQPAVVITPQGDADAVVAAAQGVDGVDSVSVYTGPQTGPPSAVAAPPLVVDGNVRVDVVTTASADSLAAVGTIEAVRDAVHAASPDALVGGASAESLDTQNASTRDLKVIVPVVLLVILLILGLLLRSVLAALLLIAANVLSFAAALGISAIVFNHVVGFPSADPSVPLYAFTFLIALGVDYSIFLMTRVREESVLYGTREGVVRGLAVTGGVITSAGVVLAATFAALGIIPLLFLAQLALIVSIGVLIDTLVVRSLLVPALVHDIGPRIWWPSRLRHEAPRVHADGAPEPEGEEFARTLR
ncbi:MMPL family transporter [Pengzhenrongella frigida]|nr:MMPL family transporter [Cellulomonas sp. HLT2-17]